MFSIHVVYYSIQIPYRAYVDVTKAKLLRASSGAGHDGVVCGPIAARIEHSAYDTDSGQCRCTALRK